MLELNRKVFLNHLRLISKTADPKSVNLNDQCIRLLSNAQGTWIMANNSAFSTLLFNEQSIDGALDVGVTPKKMIDIISVGRSENVVLSRLDNNQLQVKQGRTTAKFNTFDASTMHMVQGPQTEYTVSLPADVWLAAANKILIASSKSSSRVIGSYASQAVSIRLKSGTPNGVIEFACTDGNRLACYMVGAQCNQDAQVLVPAQAFQYIARSLVDMGSLAIEPNRIIVASNNSMFESRLLVTSFPPYEQLLYERAEASIQINKHDLSSILKQVCTVISTGVAKLILNSDELKVVSDATGAINDTGSVQGDVQTQYEGTVITALVSARYLDEAIWSFDSEQITLSMSNGEFPVRITAEGEPHVHIVMTMK